MLASIIAPYQLDAMMDLAEGTPPGAFVEVGVYHGGSAYRLYEVALRQQRELHLFDTFTGTPVFTEGLDKHKIDDEFADPYAEKAIRYLMPLAQLHVGIYPETHPDDLGPIAFIHCDCDQYLSYMAVISRLWPLVVADGAMLFDDYPYLGGAQRAVDENFPAPSLRRCAGRYYVVKDS